MIHDWHIYCERGEGVVEAMAKSAMKLRNTVVMINFMEIENHLKIADFFKNEQVKLTQYPTFGWELKVSKNSSLLKCCCCCPLVLYIMLFSRKFSTSAESLLDSGSDIKYPESVEILDSRLVLSDCEEWRQPPPP